MPKRSAPFKQPRRYKIGINIRPAVEKPATVEEQMAAVASWLVIPQVQLTEMVLLAFCEMVKEEHWVTVPLMFQQVPTEL